MDTQGRPAVLLAEDNPVNRLVAEKLIGRLGIEPDLAASGLDVLDAVSRRDYDIILMDCQMPGLDGFEATRQLRRAGYDELVIIAMTANVTYADRQACIEAGMDDFLGKPITPENLEEMLGRWIATIRERGGRARP